MALRAVLEAPVTGLPAAVLAARGSPSSQLGGTTGEEAGAVDPWEEAAGRPLATAGFSFQDLFMLTPGAQFKEQKGGICSAFTKPTERQLEVESCSILFSQRMLL